MSYYFLSCEVKHLLLLRLAVERSVPRGAGLAFTGEVEGRLGTEHCSSRKHRPCLLISNTAQGIDHGVEFDSLSKAQLNFQQI